MIEDIKTDDIYKEVDNDAEKRFISSSYETERSLPIGKNKK